eukprot:6206939-Pleurochrysis_carterae.AAC.5
MCVASRALSKWSTDSQSRPPARCDRGGWLNAVACCEVRVAVRRHALRQRQMPARRRCRAIGPT